MLKKIFAILFTITALFALSACELFLPAKNNDEVVTFDVSDFTKVESEVDTTVDTTEVESSEEDATTESEVVTTVDTTEVTAEAESSSESQDAYTPTQYSGVYNGSEITMTLTLTDYTYSLCQFVPPGFKNGYIPLCYHGKIGEENECQARALFDKNGKMVLEPIYDYMGNVSPDGKVVAYLADNEEDRGKLTGNAKPYLIDLKNNTMTLITEEELTAHRLALENNTSKTINPEYSLVLTKEDRYRDYTLFDKYGNEYYTFKDAFSANFISDEIIKCRREKDGNIVAALFDVNGTRISLETENIGSFDDGLAAFVSDGKLGIISDKGEVIIPAQIEVQDHFSAFNPGLKLNEGLMRVQVDGRLGIIEIVRK